MYMLKELLFTLTIFIFLVVGLIYLCYKDEEKFQKFLVTNNCKLISKEEGSVDIGVDSNGKLITIIGSDKKGYLCADGITYFR